MTAFLRRLFPPLRLLLLLTLEPDSSLTGATPAYEAKLDGRLKRDTSPISAAMVAP